LFIPDPGANKALDPGSGSATLPSKCVFIIPDGTLLNKIKTKAGLLAVPQVLKNLEREISLNSDLAESGRILFSFLVKISHKDFELWWKHCRKTENKVLYVLTHEKILLTVSDYKLVSKTFKLALDGAFNTAMFPGTVRNLAEKNNLCCLNAFCVVNVNHRNYFI
jgi:hypothetical protein